MSTGQGSRLLLYLTQLAKIQDPKRRKLDTFIPVHIVEDEDEDRSALRTFVEEFGLEYKEIPIHAVMSMDLDSSLSDLSFDNDTELRQQYSDLLNSIKSMTTKENLKRILRTALLTIIARKTSCRLVFLGESNDRIAINIMADICRGRGATVPWSQLPVQMVAQNLVGFLRPLKELQGQEVPAYLRIIGMEIPFVSSNSKETIYGLTDSFISGLAVDFSATPSIVTRTVAKAQTEHTPVDSASLPFCRLCLCPILDSNDYCQPCSNIINEVPLLQTTKPQYMKK